MNHVFTGSTLRLHCKSTVDNKSANQIYVAKSEDLCANLGAFRTHL